MPINERWISVVNRGPREGMATRLVAQLTREYGRPLQAEPATEPAAFSLLEDLLESTLDEAQPELSAVDHALNTNLTLHDRARAFLVEPPPWPPASIQTLNATEGSRDLVLTLADQLAPDLESRHWLLASWSGGSRPVSPTLLEELAKVADGKLATEPRFRAWLRSEWTNWARQRYRRVARLAAQGDQP